MRLSAWIGGSSLSNDDGTTQEGEEGALSQETVFDEEEVVTKALEALEAIGLRMEDDVQKNGTGWFLGSR